MIKYWAMRGRNIIKKIDIIKEDEYCTYFKKGNKVGIIYFKNESRCSMSKLFNSHNDAGKWLMKPHFDAIKYHEKIINNIKNLKV